MLQGADPAVPQSPAATPSTSDDERMFVAADTESASPAMA